MLAKFEKKNYIFPLLSPLQAVKMTQMSYNSLRERMNIAMVPCSLILFCKPIS